MKKLMPLWVFLGILLIIWIVGRLTGALQLYSTATAANYPALSAGDKMLTTNLGSPERGDFVCFRTVDQYFGNHIRIYRISGVAGDRIEIREGILYVNNKNADSLLDLAHYYTVPKDEVVRVQQEEKFPEGWIQPHGSDSFRLALHTGLIKKYQLKAVRYITPREESTPEIATLFKKPWNPDHFGPVEVPEGTYFLLGDNRHEAMDSRYIGFIPKKDVVGTVIWK